MATKSPLPARPYKADCKTNQNSTGMGLLGGEQVPGIVSERNNGDDLAPTTGTHRELSQKDQKGLLERLYAEYWSL
jgi:hypothetical protein